MDIWSFMILDVSFYKVLSNIYWINLVRKKNDYDEEVNINVCICVNIYNIN